MVTGLDILHKLVFYPSHEKQLEVTVFISFSIIVLLVNIMDYFVVVITGNYVLNYLGTRPKLASYVSQSLIQVKDFKTDTSDSNFRCMYIVTQTSFHHIDEAVEMSVVFLLSFLQGWQNLVGLMFRKMSWCSEP